MKKIKKKSDITENFLEFVDITDVVITEEYTNMVDISVDEDASFLLSNGVISHNSAGNSARTFRDSKKQGIFKLKGKFMNVTKMNDKQILIDKKGDPTEASKLMSALGLTLNTKIKKENLRYEEILIACDMDCLRYDTNILTENGVKKITEITYHDKVLTHTGVYKKVLNIIETEKGEYISMNISGQYIFMSNKHKMMIYRDAVSMEVCAEDILISDKLYMFKNNTYSKVDITDISSIISDDTVKFYDISVEDDKTFHIVLDNGDLILSHNCDGDSITGLLINFFAKWQELLEWGMVYRIQTPILVASKGKEKKVFYSLAEYEEFSKKNKGYETFYKKGLGALEDDEYEEMIKNPRKIRLRWDDKAGKLLEDWFGDDSGVRKDLLG
jgi:hypothetical protein